jgi:hypothetical protein
VLKSAAVLAVSVAACLALGAGTAQARGCHRVVAGASVFTRVSVHNGVRCGGARHKLRAWARHGFPHAQTGWYCDMSHRRKLCSFGNGNAPYFTFRRHRRVRAAAASRPAHRGERRAIARAARRSRYTQGLRGKFDVVHVRISTVDRHWGTAQLRPKPRYRRRFDTATAVMHRAHRRWSVRTLGTADLGCAIHRRAVRRDLDLQCSG